MKQLVLLPVLFMGFIQTQAKEAYGVLNDSTLTIYYDELRSSRNGTTYDLYKASSHPQWYEEKECLKIKHAIFDESIAEYYPTWLYGLFDECINLKNIEGLQYLNTSNVKDMACMFANCSSLTNLDVSTFNTSNATNMGAMFYCCNSLTSLNVSSFDTSNVTSFNQMFQGCTSIKELDLSNFNTSNVRAMHFMFEDCESLESLNVSSFDTSSVLTMWCMFSWCLSLKSLDISNFDTSNVDDMRCMFRACVSLTDLDVSNFNTSKVKDMSEMFHSCYHLTNLDVSGFVTDNVTNMNKMFRNCNGLSKLDLTGFNTNNVTDMGEMFSLCPNLITITVSENIWNTEKVANGSSIFNGCFKLVGGNGTKYDENYTGIEYARIDKPNAPGYLTAASKELEPVDNGDIDFGGSDSAIDENTDLDGSVIGNIYYNIAPGNGGYNPVEGCIEVTKPTSDEDVEELEGQDIFGEDFQKHFTGIVFKVPAGQGTITINAETVGNIVLKVRIGKQEPFEMILMNKNKIKIPYSVTKPTYVYIYAGEMEADEARGAAKASSSSSSLRIYSLEWALKKKMGDVNGDLVVDVADIASVIDVMAAGSAGDSPASADVNKDGVVDVADIATIIDIMAGGGDEDSSTGKAPAGAVAVDLGLPSGTKWANMNVGASKPEDYGLFFAWGETTGYTADTSDGRLFNWASYKWMTSGKSDWQWINKYQVADGQNDSCWYDGSGKFIGDGKATLELADDAARANWGGQWVMPTYEDMRELFDNTTNEWTTLNGVNGRKFTSKVNGNSIFLPAAGWRNGGSLYDQPSYGYYWSSTVNPSYSDDARDLYFYSGGVSTGSHYYRNSGQGVRAVLRN